MEQWKPSPEAAAIGANIRRLRIAKRVSKPELGRALGKPAWKIELYENGYYIPSVPATIAMALTLECDVVDFLVGTPAYQEMEPTRARFQEFSDLFRQLPAPNRQAFLETILADEPADTV